MGLLSSIMGLHVTTPPRYPNERRIPFNGRTAAGVFITPDRALMNSVVWAGHRYLTQTMAQLPARVMRMLPSGDSQRVTTHPVDWLLSWETNPELSPFQFVETLVGWALLYGNGVAEIETDRVGRAVNLWPIEPWRVQICRAVEQTSDDKGAPIAPGDLVYEVTNGTNGKALLAASNVFHLRAFGNGPVGLSVIEYAAQTIGWARATELFGASYFGNGLHDGGVVYTDGNLNGESMALLFEQIKERHIGPGNNHLPLILDQGLKWSKTTSTPDDAQFVATMQHQVEEICRWMGVPPHKVMHLLRATFSNIEHQAIEVVVDLIVPWARRFEQECTKKLFGQNRQGFFVKLDLKGLLRGDFFTRQQGLQIQRRNGIINADFWAEVEDMPKPGRANGGDVYFVEGNNMVPMKYAGQPPVAPDPAASQPAQAPANDDVAAMVALSEVCALLDMADAAA